MANMQRHQTYSFPQHSTQQQQQQQQTAAPRYPAAHNTSSAFSASANPNEDWTKISDLAERRRIQNRIAQRNYRKKLKRRLEDLERKASSTSVSPEPSHAELAPLPSEEKDRSSPNAKSMTRKTSQASSSYSYEQQGSPELFTFDEPFTVTNSQSLPHFSVSPAPVHSLPMYVTEPDYFCNDMQLAGFPASDFMLTDVCHPDYAQSLPQTLPTMVGGMGKQESFFGEEDFLSPFSMNYATLAGVEMSMPQPNVNYSSRTPSLSDSYSHGESRESSPPNFFLPMTPISRSASPNVQLFDQAWH